MHAFVLEAEEVGADLCHTLFVNVPTILGYDIGIEQGRYLFDFRFVDLGLELWELVSGMYGEDVGEERGEMCTSNMTMWVTVMVVGLKGCDWEDGNCKIEVIVRLSLRYTNLIPEEKNGRSLSGKLCFSLGENYFSGRRYPSV